MILVFISFHCPQLFFCPPPLPYRRSDVPDCSLLLYLTIENVFENFGKGKIARLTPPGCEIC